MTMRRRILALGLAAAAIGGSAGCGFMDEELFVSEQEFQSGFGSASSSMSWGCGSGYGDAVAGAGEVSFGDPSVMGIDAAELEASIAGVRSDSAVIALLLLGVEESEDGDESDPAEP